LVGNLVALKAEWSEKMTALNWVVR
jgi:hypothetical protein